MISADIVDGMYESQFGSANSLKLNVMMLGIIVQLQLAPWSRIPVFVCLVCGVNEVNALCLLEDVSTRLFLTVI